MLCQPISNAFYLDVHALIYKRYQQFLSQPMATAIGKIRPDTYVPNYAVLLQGQRLYLPHHLHQHSQTAMVALSAGLPVLHMRLTHVNDLFDKMIYTKMIALNLQDMVYLKAHHPAVTTPIIKPLTVQERSLQSALTGEFMDVYEMPDKLMDKNQHHRQTHRAHHV